MVGGSAEEGYYSHSHSPEYDFGGQGAIGGLGEWAPSSFSPPSLALNLPRPTYVGTGRHSSSNYPYQQPAGLSGPPADDRPAFPLPPLPNLPYASPHAQHAPLPSPSTTTPSYLHPAQIYPHQHAPTDHRQQQQQQRYPPAPEPLDFHYSHPQPQPPVTSTFRGPAAHHLHSLDIPAAAAYDRGPISNPFPSSSAGVQWSGSTTPASAPSSSYFLPPEMQAGEVEGWGYLQHGQQQPEYMTGSARVKVEKWERDGRGL